MKQRVYEMLMMLDQAPLVRYINSVSPDIQEKLLKQLESLDLSVLEANEKETEQGDIQPLRPVTIPEIDSRREEYRRLGIQAIREGKVGTVLLAGGQGSRLGFDHPKGMFNIGVNRKLYIFECLINNLLEVTREADAPVPLFIMTSVQNQAETQAFFREHHYFGYSEDNTWFFAQEELPTVDTKGKLMLSAPDRINTAPNGNGGWYASMERSGMLKVIRDSQIEWLNVFAVDNVLQRMADPCFIGAVIASGMDSGSKVVRKAYPEEKVGMMCYENGRPSIVEYYELPKEMQNMRNEDGSLTFNYGVILNYLFRVECLEKTLRVKLPLHKAFKRIKYYLPKVGYVSPDSPNANKFETLALDMVRLQKNCFAYEVDRNYEFAPVKNGSGCDSADTARELLRRNGVEL